MSHGQGQNYATSAEKVKEDTKINPERLTFAPYEVEGTRGKIRAARVSFAPFGTASHSSLTLRPVCGAREPRTDVLLVVELHIILNNSNATSHRQLVVGR